MPSSPRWNVRSRSPVGAAYRQRCAWVQTGSDPGPAGGAGRRAPGDGVGRAGVVPAGDVGDGVRDQHRRTVAPAGTVIGDERDHRMVVDEGGGHRQPFSSRPTGGHGDHRTPLATVEQGGGRRPVVDEPPGLRVGHREDDGAGRRRPPSDRGPPGPPGARVRPATPRRARRPGCAARPEPPSGRGRGPCCALRSRRTQPAPTSTAGPARPSATERRPGRTPDRER